MVSINSTSEVGMASRIHGWRWVAAVALFLTAFVAFQMCAFAQNASGSISATVADKTGAVIPDAKVVLKNEATNATRDTVTNGAGLFAFPAVQPGTYAITVTAPGLQASEMGGITLTQGGAVGLGTITLQVATTQLQIEVASFAGSVVPVDSPQASQTLSKNMIEDLSIVGRDAAELMKIMPGMGMNNKLSNSMWNSYTTASNTGPVGAFSANGTQPNGGMTMTSDGANLLDPGNQGTQTANINQNQVAEVSILSLIHI